MIKRIIKLIQNGEDVPTVYILNKPSYGEPGFYRQTMSLNAFFYSCKSRNHAPGNKIFICKSWEEFELEESILKKYGVKETAISNIFNSIWEFYEFIGYDYKTKKYHNLTH